MPADKNTKTPVNWNEILFFDIVKVETFLTQPNPGDFSDGDVSIANCAGTIGIVGKKASDGRIPRLNAYLVEDGKPRPAPSFKTGTTFAEATLFIPASTAAAWLATAHTKGSVIMIGGNGHLNGVQR